MSKVNVSKYKSVLYGKTFLVISTSGTGTVQFLVHVYTRPRVSLVNPSGTFQHCKQITLLKRLKCGISHWVNAGNNLGCQLRHNDHNNAGQQSSLQEQGLRIRLCHHGILRVLTPEQLLELGRESRLVISRGLSSALPQRTPGKQQRPGVMTLDDADDVRRPDDP